MSKKILVVDDEAASVRVLRYFLGLEGYEVVGAKDAVEALELLTESQFDLVLSDVKMPRLDGLALAKHLLSEVPVTPIFLMTAYDCDDREDILALGVPCLSKPLSLDRVLSEVKKVFGEQHQPEP